MNITRKDFLKSAGALGIFLLRPGGAAAFANALPDLAKGKLPDADELWSWVEHLAASSRRHRQPRPKLAREFYR